jgi:hypothetical protein
MDDRNALVYYGTKGLNWENRRGLSDSFKGIDGKPCKVQKSKAEGIHFGVMGDDASGGLVFRVADSTLENEVTLSLPRRHPCDTPGPAGRRISEALASELLKDAIAQNPDQADQLRDYRRRIRS